MKQPLYLTLRAIGQGAMTGSLIALAVGLAFAYLGDAALLVVALTAGPGLLAASYLLERRARRNIGKD